MTVGQTLLMPTSMTPFDDVLIDARRRTWLWIGQRILITITNSTDPSVPRG